MESLCYSSVAIVSFTISRVEQPGVPDEDINLRFSSNSFYVLAPSVV